MKPNYDKDFLQKFLNGDCSEEESQNFYDWLDHSEKKNESNWIKKIWIDSEKQEEIVLGAEERILQQILKTINIDSTTYSHNKYRSPVINLPSKSIWQANSLLRYASIIFVILIPLIAYKFINSENYIPEPVRITEKSTHNGQHLTFRLEDGTQVTLNSNSQLKYPLEFNDSSRVVTMIGEAFFEVAKDSKRPFTVVTGNVSTTALGTSFNVHYPSNKALSEISLISGSVSVKMENNLGEINDVLLIPGEQLIYQVEKDLFTTGVFNYNSVAGWKDGTIYFKEAGIYEIKKRLEIWYDVKINITGNLNKIRKENWTYSGKYKSQTLENVLRGISYVKDFTFEINDKNVEIKFN